MFEHNDWDFCGIPKWNYPESSGTYETWEGKLDYRHSSVELSTMQRGVNPQVLQTTGNPSGFFIVPFSQREYREEIIANFKEEWDEETLGLEYSEGKLATFLLTALIRTQPTKLEHRDWMYIPAVLVQGTRKKANLDLLFSICFLQRGSQTWSNSQSDHCSDSRTSPTYFDGFNSMEIPCSGSQTTLKLSRSSWAHLWRLTHWIQHYSGK